MGGSSRRLALAFALIASGAVVAADAAPVAQPAARGPHPYIVVLADAPLATYRGGIAGLAATSADATTSAHTGRTHHKLDLRSAASIAYLAYLERRQARLRGDASRALGRALRVEHPLRVALNAVIVRLTADEAAKLERLPGVRIVQRSLALPLDTDRGPIFIGAPGLWDGTATGLAGAQGEGVVIGILDSGINGDHPSFAAVGGDGYVHVNPLGSGNYLGECFATPDIVCNDKLIGRYNFTDSIEPAPSSEDEDGHGSHVASTAAGNWLYDVPIIDGEGNPSEYSLGTLHGVAPHANLIAYRVCNPSCASADVVSAIEQAIVDGVDVLNKSISSPTGSPWSDPLALAHLSARAAGISFAISAGNDGPEPGTVAQVNAAPWNAVVAAVSHDRGYPFKGLSGLAGGDTPPPAGILGKGLTGGHSGPIVYAAHYDNGDPNPEQCVNVFPAGTWTHGEIVLCDRGTGGRIQKCIEVRDGGAAGCILTNIDDGLTSIEADAHVIPAIHIDAASGAALKAWLASGSDHTGTIEASGLPVADPTLADHLADFSSRGPYTGYDWLAPSLAAPGLAIYAAYKEPREFNFLQGTSMASPHVAGSMALLRQVRGDWTDAEILSALMTTATHELVKEDGVTPADPFDFGGGRVQVDRAVNAGLVLDESVAHFEMANPLLGGDPRTLNVAGLVDDHCLLECRWERTVRATVAGTWTASASGAFDLRVEPDVFTLAAGATQRLTINVGTSGAPANAFAFGAVGLTPSADGAPATVLPVAVVPRTSNFADEVGIAATRDAGSQLLRDLLAIEIPHLQIQLYGLSKGDIDVLSITGETGAFDPYEQDDGVGLRFFDVAAGAARFIARTFDSQAPDVDLFVGRDDNSDGAIAPNEELCNSGSATANEHCEILDPEPGRYWIAVINYAASAPGATDDTHLQVVAVTPGGDDFFAAGPADGIPALQPFDLRLSWHLDGAEIGDTYYGNVVLGSDAGSEGDVGNIPVTLVRGNDDVAFVADPELVDAGGTMTYTITVAGNFTNEDRAYEIEAHPPPDFDVVADSLDATSGTAALADHVVRWSVMQPTSTGPGDPIRGPATLSYQAQVALAASGGAVTSTATSVVDNPGSEPVTASVTLVVNAAADGDGDGLRDFEDNCTEVANPSQCDSDLDGYGNHCDGDFDDSDLVDDDDLALLKVGFFGTTLPPAYDERDLNCDGYVNMLDLGRFKAAYGLPPGPSGLAGVP